MALIDCKQVSLGYENRIVAQDINFQVNRGDLLCIVGENGSGKSTLMKAILGLKDTESGHLHYGDGLTAKQVGYLPQQTTAQRDFPASVFEVVLSGCLSSKKHSIFYTESLLPRAFRRPAAAGAFGAGAVRHNDASGIGRAGLRARSAGDCRFLQADPPHQPRLRHHGHHGVARSAGRAFARDAYFAHEAKRRVFRHKAGIPAKRRLPRVYGR